MNKILVAVFAMSIFSQLTFAADVACEAKAAEKKLAGAAKNSFIKKCEKDTIVSSAKSACEAKAAEKKLKGAAKNSFTKKCITDASQ